MILIDLRGFAQCAHCLPERSYEVRISRLAPSGMFVSGLAPGGERSRTMEDCRQSAPKSLEAWKHWDRFVHSSMAYSRTLSAISSLPTTLRPNDFQRELLMPLLEQ